MAARYYHKCPVCGRRRLCRGVYGTVNGKGQILWRQENHEIKCTAKCRGKRLAVKTEQFGGARHYIRCM